MCLHPFFFEGFDLSEKGENIGIFFGFAMVLHLYLPKLENLRGGDHTVENEIIKKTLTHFHIQSH
jgi:hypothetical protein